MSRLISKYTNNLSRSKPAVSVLLDVCSRNAVKSSRYISTLCEMSRLSPLICPTMLRTRQLMCQGLTNVKTIQKYCTLKTDDEVPIVVKLLGVHGVDAKEILSFLGDNVGVVGGEKGVHFGKLKEGGRRYIFVEVVDEKSFENALQIVRICGSGIMKGYVAAFRSSKSFMDICCKRGDSYQTGCLVKISRLPPKCSTAEITEFFEGLEVVPDGISFDGDYRKVAFVQFASQEMVKKALLRNFDRIHNSHIGVIPYNPSFLTPGELSEEIIEMQSLEESTGNRTIHSVLMIGLPDTADETYIKNFFAPLKVTPVRIEIHPRGNRATAVVFFKRFLEVLKALEKQNSYIGQHSIQLRANPMDELLLRKTRKKRKIQLVETN